MCQRCERREEINEFRTNKELIEQNKDNEDVKHTTGLNPLTVEGIVVLYLKMMMLENGLIPRRTNTIIKHLTLGNLTL